MMVLSQPLENPERTLIDALLEEQRNLTPVERFARQHHNGPPGVKHLQLIPAGAPHPGAQYAFEVDLDRCSGCKSCVTACHALNGLDDGEAWRDTGLLLGRGEHSVQQTITTACHHCVDPACLNGCPVLAYDKDPLTGIVRHLDDQCIGCQYCVLMCPYEVPKYSESRGIVRKCDMCHQRLAHGDAPACVQACPSEAIRITVIEAADVARLYRQFDPIASPARNLFLPSSPDPAITVPTTRYISKRPLPVNLHSAEGPGARIQPAHYPLVWMLVLTQLGVGGFAVLPIASGATRPVLAVIALGATALGLGASVLHLGRPQKAWRVFLGLRRSWLSREVVVFGGFALLAAAVTAGLVGLVRLIGQVGLALECAAMLVGLLGVFCSGMTYHVTRRECWRGEWSIGRFFGTMLLLGLAAAWCATAWAGSGQWVFSAALPVAVLAKLSRELAFLRQCPDDADLNEEWPDSYCGRGAYLMRFRLGILLRGRFTCAWIGGVVMPLFQLIAGSPLRWLALAALLICVAGELMERTLFFRTGVAARMPGGAA